MIVSYPNYLDQTQSIGLSGIIQWHGEHFIVTTPFPLCISTGMQLEYGISSSKQLEYGISSSKQLEYGITITKGGCT